MKFLLLYPKQSVELFLSDTHMKECQWTRCFESLLTNTDGKAFRDELQDNQISRLITLATTQSPPVTAANKVELQYQAILFINVLVCTFFLCLSLMYVGYIICETKI